MSNSRGFRRRGVALAVVAALLVAVAGCGTGGLSSTSTVGPTPTGAEQIGTAQPASSGAAASSRAASPAAPVAAVSASPGFGTAGMAPAQPVTVTVARGVIDTLTMTGPDGAALAGTVSPDHQTWTLGQNLAFGAAYTVTGTATGTDGRQVPITGTFGTAGTDRGTGHGVPR